MPITIIASVKDFEVSEIVYYTKTHPIDLY